MNKEKSNQNETIDIHTQAKQKFQESEDSLRICTTIVNDSDDAIIQQDFVGKILAWNKGAEHIYGYSAKEIVGKNISSIIPKNKIKEEEQFIDKIINGDVVPSFETTRKTKAGNIVDIWMVVTKIVDEDRNPIGIASTERDITERKQAEEEKEKRAAELIIAKKELLFQNEEKEKRAAELIIANKELLYQNEEKEKRAAELIIANKELLYQNEEKEKRAAELIIADEELHFQNEEKEKRAAELIIANKELLFQNEEKEKRAAELIIANKELTIQGELKEKRAAELIIANKELLFQNEEKEKRAAELVVANKELTFQNEEKEKRAAEFNQMTENLEETTTSRDKLNAEIEERKKVEESLIEVQENLLVAQRMAHIGNWHWNIKTDIVWWSDELYCIYGLNPEEYTPSMNSSVEKMHPDDRERVRKAVDDALKAKKPYDVEMRVIRPGGIERMIHAHGEVSFNNTGNPQRMFGTAQDITESKQAEERILQFNEELKNSNQELEQFAYVASHDLQEPLRMISSYTQLLERRYGDKLDQDAKDFIEFAVDGANRMQKLINDLLEYSRVTTRGKPSEKVDVYTILGQAISNLQHSIVETNAIVTNNDLPKIRADGAQLVRVFQNIIDNAIKFHSEETPRIHVSAQEDKNEWVFSISDNGIGIDEQYKNCLFTIFQRLHTKEEYPGTGIGLAICKRIVQRHNGRIWFKSELGKGTTFYFTLKK